MTELDKNRYHTTLHGNLHGKCTFIENSFCVLVLGCEVDQAYGLEVKEIILLKGKRCENIIEFIEYF